MNKNDFRLQMPLWNAGFFFILVIFSFSVVYAIDTWNSNYLNVFLEDGTFYINRLAIISCIIGLTISIVYFFVYILKIIQYNKMNPTRKIKFTSFIHLSEFVDDDEMMQQITNAATRKVYVYYSSMAPLILLLLFFPLHRYIYIVALSFIIIGQYIIYYLHLSKYAEGISKTHIPLFNKRIVTITFATLFILVAASFSLFYKLEKDQESNSQLIKIALMKVVELFLIIRFSILLNVKINNAKSTIFPPESSGFIFNLIRF